MIIKTVAYPRAALIGNPSDGYFGKTIAFTFSNFQADVTLYQTPELQILPHQRDHSKFKGLKELYEDVRAFGYYGGIRLLKATLKKFYEYCERAGIDLDERTFTIRYHTSIPTHLGLAGSSAIITACIRALISFYSIEIPKPVLANLVLSVETEELGIGAGLQDRVAQVYQGMVFMDFSRELMEKQGYGNYEYISPPALPDLYLAFKRTLSEGTEKVHNSLRYRYENGDTAVHAAMERFAELTGRVRELLECGEIDKIGGLLNENFDLRRSIIDISRENVAMVEAARAVGASAKFTGSGGAVIGTYTGEEMFARLETALGELGVEVIRPRIV
jgi:glucuronokinase